MTKHRLAQIGASVVATLGLGGTAAALAASPATAAPRAVHAARANATSPADVPLCTAAQLQGSLTNANGTAGSTYETLNLLNTGATSCSTFGYPGVSWISTVGTQVGQPADRTASSYRPVVVLAPGHAAQAVLQVTDAENYDAGCGITPTSSLQVYPPDQTTPIYVPDAQTTCVNTADHTLAVGPLVPGPADGGTGPTT